VEHGHSWQAKEITVFTRARHFSLTWARWIQSTPSHPISLRSSLMLSSHLRLGLPSGLFPTGFPSKILSAFLPCVLQNVGMWHKMQISVISTNFIWKIMRGREYLTKQKENCDWRFARNQMKMILLCVTCNAINLHYKLKKSKASETIRQQVMHWENACTASLKYT
jgi:hypothetical protein